MLFFLPWLALPAHARVDPPHPVVDPHQVDGTAIGDVIDLTSTWLLKQGDDPSYADPKLDDSHWLVVALMRPLSSYGLNNVDTVWYRTHVKLRPDAHDLVLDLRGFPSTRQVFVNGIQIASSLDFPPGGEMNTVATDRIYRIPKMALDPGDLTIAIRAGIGRLTSKGIVRAASEDAAILLGTASMTADEASLYIFRSFTSNVANATLEILLFLITVALAIALRSEREYFTLAIYLFADIGLNALFSWRVASGTGVNKFIVAFEITSQVVTAIALLEFVRLVLGISRSRLIVIYEWIIVVISYSAGTFLTYRIYGPSGAVSNGFIIAANVIYELTFLPLHVGLPILAFWVWWKRRNPDALLLFFPLLIQVAFSYVSFAHFVGWRLHLFQTPSLGEPPIPWLYVQWEEITFFIFSVSLLLFLVLRTIRLARSRAEVAAEIEAAQTVQQVLLARSSQATPGFVVESVYLPANEVGGDFFLVSPGQDGSLLAIVGDVSGKGLIAAMRVSMILGVLRREDSRDPRAVLHQLNEALLSQSEMGFTTACCVWMDAAGRYSIANAGHIAPYVDGHEVVTPPSLPLGLAPDQEYELVEGVLPRGLKLVLMSDGVVEAKSEKGDLLGFDRLPSLTLSPAAEIAKVAEDFGQDDDITVLTIACAV
jgi:hypothetical protein